MFFYVGELIVILLLVHQVALPMLLGMPVFPFFREKKLQDELSEVKQQVKEKQIKNDINNVKRELKGRK